MISLGAIARHALDLFKKFDYQVIAYDPFLSEAEATELGVELVDLDTLLKEAYVVSRHTPLLDSTRGMIKGKYFLSMKRNATFINTVRGAAVDEPEMVEALEKGRYYCVFRRRIPRTTC